MSATSTPTAPQTVEHLDARDRGTVAARMAPRQRCDTPQVGDYVRFADGTLERISEPLGDGRAQTSTNARFQLREHGECYCTSGTQNQPIALGSLRATGTRHLGAAWIWHHDEKAAHNGVEFRVAFSVFECPDVTVEQACRETPEP